MKIKYIIITIVILTIIMLISFYCFGSSFFFEVASNELEKDIKFIINDYHQYIEIDSTDLINVKKNNKDEIIYIHYNMNKVYYLVGQIVEYIENEKSKLENGVWRSVPIGVVTNNVFLSFMGPKIPVGVKFVGKIMSEVKTNVTNYGLNNALISIILEVKMDYKIIIPVNYPEKEIKYTILLDSFITQGNVPNWYGSIPNEKVFMEF